MVFTLWGLRRKILVKPLWVAGSKENSQSPPNLKILLSLNPIKKDQSKRPTLKFPSFTKSLPGFSGSGFSRTEALGH